MRLNQLRLLELHHYCKTLKREYTTPQLKRIGLMYNSMKEIRKILSLIDNLISKREYIQQAKKYGLNVGQYRYYSERLMKTVIKVGRNRYYNRDECIYATRYKK